MRPVLARLLACCLLLQLVACGGTAATAVTITTTASFVASIPSSAAAAATSATSPSAASASSASSAPVAASSTSVDAAAASSASATPPATTAYPLTVRDDQGAGVTFVARPRHVVSLAPSDTEIVYAVGGGDVFSAGTQYDTYPPEAKGKALIKGLKPSLEAITAYQPDLVLASSANAGDLLQQLRATHVPVLYLDARDFAGVYHDLLLVGQVLDGVPAAQKVVDGMQREVAGVRARTAQAATKPRVFVELDAGDPAKLFTVGPGSFIDSLVTMSGGVNVARDARSPYPQLSLEALVAADPQVILLNDAAYGVTPQAVAQRAGWSSLSAVTAQHVYPIDDDLVSRPGPRLADGLAAMAKLIHPELFP